MEIGCSCCRREVLVSALRKAPVHLREALVASREPQRACRPGEVVAQEEDIAVSGLSTGFSQRLSIRPACSCPSGSHHFLSYTAS